MKKLLNTQKMFFVLRLAFGWFMLYAGLSKILYPEWTAVGYLQSAQTFSALYSWLSSPPIIEVVNFLNMWGLTFLGISLIFGIFLKTSTLFGALVMMLYYFPVLDFPKAGEYSFIIDEHILYALMLLLIGKAGESRFLSIDGWLYRRRH